MPLNQKRLSYSLFLIFMVIFTLIVAKGLAQSQPGDENVYYYMGKLISEGKVPYRNFFYAHPPLQIYLISLIYKIFGFNIVILKSIPLVSTIISAFFIFKISKEKFGSIEAITSSLLFLFSYSVMFNSVFSFGIDVATTFLVIGVYFLWVKNNYALSGIFFGLAGITRLLTLIPISIILITALFQNKRNFLKLSSTFLIIFLLVNGFFALLFGNDYLTPVYKFHLLKKLGSRENFKEYVDIIKLNWILFSSAFLFIFVKEKKPANIFAIISIAYLMLLTVLNKIFGFYFIIVFPFLAVMGSYSVVKLYQKLINKQFKIAILTILFLLFSWNLASDILFLEKIGFVGFERGNDLRDFVLQNSNKNTMLFGDESVVPLLALLTNKKIALDIVDTNDQIFTSGVKDLNKILAELKGKDILFVVRSKQGISYFKEVREFLNKNCDFLSQFSDEIEGSYLIYRCSR